MLIDLAITSLLGATAGTIVYFLVGGSLGLPAALVMGMSIGVAYALGEARGERNA